MSDSRSELEKIDSIYTEYARTTLPKGKGWVLFMMVSIGLLILVPTILHRVYKIPLLPNEVDIVQIIASLIGIVFVVGITVQGREKPVATPFHGIPKKFAHYLVVIRSLLVFQEKDLNQFIGFQKEEWAEADKKAEMSVPILVVFVSLISTLANWGHQPKAPFALVLALLGILLFVMNYSRTRLAKLRRFEFFVQQALIQKEELRRLEPIEAPDPISQEKEKDPVP